MKDWVYFEMKDVSDGDKRQTDRLTKKLSQIWTLELLEREGEWIHGRAFKS